MLLVVMMLFVCERNRVCFFSDPCLSLRTVSGCVVVCRV